MKKNLNIESWRIKKYITSILMIALMFNFFMTGYAQQKKEVQITLIELTFNWKAKLRRANALYQKFAYTSAISLYEKALEREDNNSAKIKLAHCYRLTKQTEEAEYWYSQIVNLPESNIMDKLYYAESLRSNGKYQEAKKWYFEYASLNPSDARGMILAKSMDFVDNLVKDSLSYKVVNLSINSIESDIGPAYYKNGLVFSSSRSTWEFAKYNYHWTSKPFLNLYEVSLDNNNIWEEPKLFSNAINTKFHDGPITFDEQSRYIYFTRNNYNKGRKGKSMDEIVKLKIYKAELIENGWRDIEELPFNSDEYSTGHPCLSKDGNALYFVSDMPGGYGGTDIYVSYIKGENAPLFAKSTYQSPNLNANKWSKPVNLGSKINTAGDEMTPFFTGHDVLYFSSDGHIGLGGLDIYSTKKVNGEWVKIRNLGYPINTSQDDFGLIIDTNNIDGYFSSNRKGSKGDDDIYSFKKLMFDLNVSVVKEENNEIIKNAEVKLINLNKGYDRGVVRKNGNYFFSTYPGKKYQLTTELEGYVTDTTIISLLDESCARDRDITVSLSRDIFSVAGYVEVNEENEKLFSFFSSVKGLIALNEVYFSGNRDSIDNLESKINQICERIIVEFGNFANDKLKFKVQVGAFKNAENFNAGPLENLNQSIQQESTAIGITRFVLGDLTTVGEAEKLRLKTQDRGIADAFIVVYYEGERVNSDNITNICVDLYE